MLYAKKFQSKINLLNVSEGYWAGTKICEKNLNHLNGYVILKLKKNHFGKFFLKNSHN